MSVAGSTVVLCHFLLIFTRRELAAHFGLTPKNVQLWFQNQRQRNKGAKLRGSAQQSFAAMDNEKSAWPAEVSTASVQVDPARIASGAWRGSHMTSASSFAFARANLATVNTLPNGGTSQCWPNAPQPVHIHQGMTAPLRMPPSSTLMVSRPPTGWQAGAAFGMCAQPLQHEGEHSIRAMHPTPQCNRPGWCVSGYNVEVVPSPMPWACRPHSEQQRLQQLSAERDFHSRFEQAGWTCLPIGQPCQPFGAMQWTHAIGGSSLPDSLPLLPPSGAHGHGVYQMQNMPNFSSSSSCKPQRMGCWPGPAA
eukprot:6194322-Pleurochrysis_carterae.AAC.3